MVTRHRRTSATARGMAVVLAAAMLGAAPTATSPATAADDTTFTIAVVPDTQNEVVTDSALMANRYQWIADHKSSDSIQFVVHTGDVTNWGVADPTQFTRASNATTVLDGSGIPYAYATGNHDGAAVTVGGSAAPGDVRANLRDTTLFNTTFPLSRFKNVGGTFEPGKVDNMYQTFSAGGKDWLVLTLEMWPRTAALTWADSVLTAHPDHNVIINTHANINGYGERVTTGVYGDNNAQAVWDKLGSKHANVRMILSGHYEPKNGSPGAAYNEVTGANGNKVLQVMTAYTSTSQNHVRTLKVDTKTNTVTSAVQVPLSTNKALPSGKITDAASDFVARDMSFLPTTPTPPVIDDTAFTIAVVPDTRNEVVTDSALMANRYQWIADHKSSDSIQFVVHTGDVTNWGVADPTQFTRASNATTVLDGSGIPYAYATGSHDTAAVTVGGSAAPGDVRANLRDTTLFNTTFPLSRFKNVGGTFEPGKVDNMYQTFSAGGKDWLVLTLEMWPRTAALTWADSVLTAHPDHNVIINTHANINSRGERVTTGVYGDNNAQAVWDKLGSKHANVRMILSGHHNESPGAAYSLVTGVNGNKVLQVMTAYTSTSQNHVRTLKVDTKTNTVTSAVQVPLSTNKAVPSGKITDTASDFVARDMSFLPTGAPAVTELLPDGGFEKDTSGWSPFSIGTMTRVTSPVRSGSYAMKITSPSMTYALVGMTQNTAVTSSTSGKTYTATCYVRPSTADLEVRIRLLQYTQNFGSNEKLGTTIISTLPADAWTKVTVTGTATASGQRIIPQIYATFQTAATGYLVYDDCSLR